MVLKDEVLGTMTLVRCNLCGWETDDQEHNRISRLENHHEGTEMFVVGRQGRQRRARNRIIGKVKWIFIC